MPNASESILEVLRRCLQSGSESDWEKFVQETKPAVRQAIQRASSGWGHASTERLEDLVQDVYAKLCAKDFESLRRISAETPGELFSYLRTMGSTVSIDSIRSWLAQRHGAGSVHESIEDYAQAPDESAEVEIERRILLQQVDACLKRNPAVPARDRTIFWMYYRDGYTAAAIAKIKSFELTTHGVDSALRRAVQAVHNCLQRGKGKHPGLTS